MNVCPVHLPELHSVTVRQTSPAAVPALRTRLSRRRIPVIDKFTPLIIQEALREHPAGQMIGIGNLTDMFYNRSCRSKINVAVRIRHAPSDRLHHGIPVLLHRIRIRSGNQYAHRSAHLLIAENIPQRIQHIHHTVARIVPSASPPVLTHQTLKQNDLIERCRKTDAQLMTHFHQTRHRIPSADYIFQKSRTFQPDTLLMFLFINGAIVFPLLLRSNIGSDFFHRLQKLCACHRLQEIFRHPDTD